MQKKSAADPISIPYNWTPRNYQIPVWKAMDEGIKRIDCVWHRRAGKDLTFLNRAIVEAHRRVGTYYHMMPKLNQARKAIWDGMDKHGRPFLDYIPREIVKNRNETEMQVELKCGSIWQLVGADNYDNLMSTNAVGIVFSEYSLCNPRAWDFFRPILRENGGWAAFLYTPRGRNHAYDLHVMAKQNPDWFSQVLEVDKTGIVTPEDIEDERRSGMTEDMIQQEFFCSFDAAVPGAYYSSELRRAREQGRITKVPFQGGVPVDTWWDLGIDDSMSIWFTQDVGREIHVIRYFEHRGEGLDYYAAELDRIIRAWGGVYGRHTAPHDITVREIGTGKTRLVTAGNLGLKFEIAQRPARKEDGHQAVRNIFPTLWFDETNCQAGIDGLASYHSEYDEKNRVLKTTPVHDWASHCFTGDTQLLTRYGMCQIMNLPNTGEVHTSCGWKPYHSPRITRKNAPLVEVAFKDGLTVRCTPDHLFLTGNGWKYARYLTPGTLIQSSLIPSPNTSVEDCIGYTPAKNTLLGVARNYIGLFGSRLLEMYQRVAIFTTSMPILLTICSGISNVSNHLNTCQLPGRRFVATGQNISPIQPERRQQNGIDQRPVGYGINDTPREQKVGPNGNVNSNRVYSVVKSLWRWFARGYHKNIATNTAAMPTIASVNEISFKEDVWCLTVPDGNSFSLANGAIVHNCADALQTLAIKHQFVSLMQTKETPRYRGEHSWM